MNWMNWLAIGISIVSIALSTYVMLQRRK